MASLWFWIVTATLVSYAVLDGFALGAGATYLAVAKTNDERRRVIGAVGWGVNELWLIAAAGAIYFAFPKLYESLIGGFREVFVAGLILLILRRVGVLLRNLTRNSASHSLPDLLFGISSVLLSLFFGVLMGNVVRGVPLNAAGSFYEPVWDGLKLSANPGIIDWFTALTSLVALVTFTAHGSYFLALKTDEDLGRRARGFALLLWPVQFFLTFSTMVATYFIRPEIMANYEHHRIGLIIPAIGIASLGMMVWAVPNNKEKVALVASSLYLISLLGGTAYALYPVLLPARDHQFNLTAHNSGAAVRDLSATVVWLLFAAIIAVAYFIFVHRASGGKARIEEAR